MGRHVLRRPILVYFVCLCPIKKDARLIWVKKVKLVSIIFLNMLLYINCGGTFTQYNRQFFSKIRTVSQISSKNCCFFCIPKIRGERWLTGRASDSGSTGRGFETCLRRIVSLSKTFFSPKVLVIPRKP